jgi:uncharacterized protein
VYVSPYLTGISFIGEALTEDAVLAGYGKVELWVSSTSDDMDIYVSLRVVDTQDREVDFTGPTTMKGWLKASHRKIDPERSTRYTVKHTHLKADYAPLKQGEVYPVEIELSPNTAMLRQGHRLPVDVQSHDGVAHGITPHEYNPLYHTGAVNRIHTGPEYDCYVQLPVIPRRE